MQNGGRESELANYLGTRGRRAELASAATRESGNAVLQMKNDWKMAPILGPTKAR